MCLHFGAQSYLRRWPKKTPCGSQNPDQGQRVSLISEILAQYGIDGVFFFLFRTGGLGTSRFDLRQTSENALDRVLAHRLGDPGLDPCAPFRPVHN